MCKFIIFTLLSSFVFTAYAQDPQLSEEDKNEEVPSIAIDLEQFCVDAPVESTNIQTSTKILPSFSPENTTQIKNDCLFCRPNQTIPSLQSNFTELIEGTLAPLDKLQDELNIILPQQSFCTSLKSYFRNQKERSIVFKVKDEDNLSWSLKLYFGYTRAKYGNSDLTVQSTQVTGTFDDFQWKERHSFEYFRRESLKGKGNTFRFLDEPTSSFGLIMEKEKHVLVFSIFHLKYLKENYQTVKFKGLVNGIEVDGPITENKPFEGYDIDPEQMYLRRFENTWWQINPQFGYGRKLNLAGSEKAGKLTYTPYAQAGFVLGTNFSAYKSDSSYWDTDEYQTGLKFKGVTASAGHRLEYEKGRGSLFLDHKVTVAKMNHAFLDGTAKYNIVFAPLTFGAGFKIIKEKKKTVPVVVEP